MSEMRGADSDAPEAYAAAAVGRSSSDSRPGGSVRSGCDGWRGALFQCLQLSVTEKGGVKPRLMSEVGLVSGNTLIGPPDDALHAKLEVAQL